MNIRGTTKGLVVMLMMLSAAGSIARAAGDCPASVLTYATHFQAFYASVPATALDTIMVSSTGDTTHMGFDRTKARITLNALGGVWAGVRVPERFIVTGVPVGTVVSATVTLSLEGEVFNAGGSGGANFAATLAGVADSVVMDASIPGKCYGCTKQVSTVLTLPVSIAAGTPLDVAFDLIYHDTPAGYGSATIVATYGISGLPPGVRAVECFESDVTPVRHVSWGRLKAAYR